MKFLNGEGSVVELREVDDKGITKYGIFDGTEFYEDTCYMSRFSEAEDKIKNLAKDGKWIPLAIQDAVLDTTKAGLQGESFKTKAYRRLDAEEAMLACKRYIEADLEITRLEEDLVEEVKTLKAECRVEVEKLKKEKADLENEVTLGMEEIEVDASWERSPQENVMYKVDRLTLAFLDVREMTAEEKNPELFDGPTEEDFDDNTNEEPVVEEEMEPELSEDEF